MTRAAAHLYLTLHTALTVADRRLASRHGLRIRQERRDRGDVPGWVLITVMTAGLVSAIWLLAGPALTSMFTNSLSKVTGK